ncbi:lipopolysaccharide biosynthesis protein [Bacillus sp. B-jedd]|uniref:lipopolysaccharide biosynthesis protein n=1 Tax=Bacillus sp. B-jedd TaxID=1476857 RepID=UPI00051568D4|nr:hypothetical protein [Bacillus sp. B-jedd]CEG29106.1 hypothetical protein BN1002_04036 [Bacillus sp. B-jedd]
MLAYFKKNIYKDSLLNIIASLILTIAVQGLAYPFLAFKFTISEYGVILTILGIINSVGISLGNSLNNTRILLQSEYDKKGLSGDYNILFIAILLIGSIGTGILTTITIQSVDWTVIGSIFITILVMFRSYYTASFRIIIDYKKIMYTSIWGFVGYIIGVIIMFFFQYWVILFICGELFACIYVFYSSKIIHDKFRISNLFNKSLNKFTLIMFAAVISNLMMYMDRFYIYPLMGPEKVAVYTVASFLGKTVSIILTPIAGVLLTYYTKQEQLDSKSFYKQTIIFSLVSFFIYIILIVVGIPICRIFYPTLIDQALPYFYIGNLAAILFILGNIIQPSLLRFCETKWQLITQVIYFVIYLIFGYFGMIKYELYGFIYAIIIANVFRIFIMLLVITLTLKQLKNNELMTS